MGNEPINLNLTAYRHLFTFENNLRSFIKFVLFQKYGSDWFLDLDISIRNESNTQKSKIIKYLNSNLMDDNPLNYLFLSSLKNIIEKEWDTFFPFFQNANQVKHYCLKKIKDKFFELEVIRNFLAHSHLVDDNLITQLKANIAFFESYIPDYNRNIYNSVLEDNSPTLLTIFKNIHLIVEKRENVPSDYLTMLKYSGDDLTDLLIGYNKIPKTRDKKLFLENYILKNNILHKLKTKVE